MMLGNLQYRGALLIWIIEGLGLCVHVAGADVCVCVLFFFIIIFISSVWQTVRYKGPLNTNHYPINHLSRLSYLYQP